MEIIFSSAVALF